MSMSAESILRTLVEIRAARRAKFVPYDLDRRLKRKEKDAWNAAEEYFTPKQVSTGIPEPLKSRKQAKQADAA